MYPVSQIVSGTARFKSKSFGANVYDFNHYSNIAL